MDSAAIACPSSIAALDPGLCQAVDIYCERTSAALLAEPLNAVSNLAFLIAAWFAWRVLHKSDAARGDRLLGFLVALIAAIGLGSTLFHLLAVRWAAWADVIPIMIFMLAYLWLALRRYCGSPDWLAALGLGLFGGVTFNIERLVPTHILRGGAMYLPALLALAAMTLAPVPSAVRRGLITATAVFLVSYGFRTLDQPICPVLPVGTHFLWHCLNGVLLYLLVRAALLQRESARREANAAMTVGNRAPGG